MNEFSEKYEWKIWIEKIIQTYDVADTCQCACYPKIWDSKKNL